jgi:N-acetylmuramoyl-L-alanine amidase
VARVTRIIDRPSPNFDARKSAIDLVVLHYTGMQNAEVALSRLTDPAPVAGLYPGPWQDPEIDPTTALGRVSAHYVVDEAGAVYRLVDEESRAWHAGASSWEGRTDTNDRSIGIEIVNGGHDFGLPDFPEPQIEAVIVLVKGILARRNLNASRVVGHSDMAPGRKLDPGEKFPWSVLADHGVALAPKCSIGRGGARVLGRGDEGEAVLALQKQLRAIGYGLDLTGVYDERTFNVVRAFQARFRQGDVSGTLDEETRNIVDYIAVQIAVSRFA